VREPTEALTPEEAAALRELAATHRRRHRWFALFWSVVISVHMTVILHTIWHGWPLDERDWRRLAFFVLNAFFSLGLWEWALRQLRTNAATERRWRLQDMRWRAQRRVWSQPREERRRQLREE
jgi:hypothetical protein